MPLIQCPECGKEISDSSSRCMQCGFPIKKIILIKKFYNHSLIIKEKCKYSLYVLIISLIIVILTGYFAKKILDINKQIYVYDIIITSIGYNNCLEILSKMVDKNIDKTILYTYIRKIYYEDFSDMDVESVLRWLKWINSDYLIKNNYKQNTDNYIKKYHIKEIDLYINYDIFETNELHSTNDKLYKTFNRNVVIYMGLLLIFCVTGLVFIASNIGLLLYLLSMFIIKIFYSNPKINGTLA